MRGRLVGSHGDQLVPSVVSRVGPRNRQTLIFAGASVFSRDDSASCRCAEVLGAQPLRTRSPAVAEPPRAPRARVADARRSPRPSASERASALRRWANAAWDEARAARRSGRGARAPQHDQHAVDVGNGGNDVARDARWTLTSQRELGQHARDAVGRACGRRGKPLPDLLLDHRDPERRRRAAPRSCAGSRSRRSRTAGWRRPSSAPGRSAAQVERHRVGDVQRHVARRIDRVTQRRLERAVEFDDVDVRDARREVLAEHAEPAADLEDDVAGPSSAARSITPRMFESMRKFWPRSRLGRTPKSRIRRRLGCVGPGARSASASLTTEQRGGVALDERSSSS